MQRHGLTVACCGVHCHTMACTVVAGGVAWPFVEIRPLWHGVRFVVCLGFAL
jgi:hypothetical protein